MPAEDMKDFAWKWRCKIVGQKNEKSLSDFSSADDVRAVENTSSSAAPANRAGSKDPGFGGAAAIKTFYEGKNSNDSYIDWQDFPPRQISKSAAKAQDRVAVKVYKVKDRYQPVISGRFALKYHRIDIQNPLLVAALEPILKAEDVHLEVNEVATFNEPFRSLFFCYDEIDAKSKSLAGDDPLRPFILLLLRLLDEIFAEARSKKKQLGEKGLICYKHAWAYFARDSIILSHGRNCDLLSKVVSTAYIKPTPVTSCLQIRCKVLRFNGEAFVWEEQELNIPEFEGNKLVARMDHYPLEFHEEAEAVKAKMAVRGRMVLDYQGVTYCLYTGVGVFQEEKRLEKHNVDGRILIDVVGYNKHHLAQGVRENKDPETSRHRVRGTGRVPDTVSAAVPSSENSVAGKRLTKEEQDRNTEAMLEKPDDLMFMSPLVQGYALKNKLWLTFYVEDIRPMVWNDQAFDHLVYDEQQKDLVLSFVESHGRSKPVMEDVILGKGNGLITLLSGPPGSGKTLTAEAVADRTHRPLFYLQAEDLGINAAALGANVKRVFQMATEWDAVILLDEADVFMANRHPQDIARNELVSIFLRELEYFRGIIFLTTNLYDTIDSAFRSRVSLHLLFKPLPPDARLLVWRKFLDRLPKKQTAQVTELEDKDKDKGQGKGKDEDESAHGPAAVGDGQEQQEQDAELGDEDLKELAAWSLNGREIKTAVKMVKSWCDHKGYAMTLERLENGIKVTSPHASKITNADDTDLYD